MAGIKSLYRRLPANVRASLRQWVPGPLRRWYAHHKTQVYLISYPKCGRTWLRLMIGYALMRYFSLPEIESVLFLSPEFDWPKGVPRSTVIHDDRPMLKTPEELEKSKERFRTKKESFLVRDPRDVIVSLYYEKSMRSKLWGNNPYEAREAGFEGSLEEFIHSRVGGFATLIAFYNIWAENQETPLDFLLVRYEDMKKDTAGELRRVLDFLGLDEISPEIIQAAVEYASFENMRAMEQQGKFQTGILKPADPRSQETYKTRKGKVGGFAEELSKEEVNRLNAQMRQTLASYFNYQA